jgi:MFS family permease
MRRWACPVGQVAPVCPGEVTIISSRDIRFGGSRSQGFAMESSVTMKRVFPILALCVFSATLGIGVISPLLPLYISSMGATGVDLGIIVASYAISHTIAVPLVGRLSDRKGRKVFLTAGLFFYSLVSIGYIYAGDVAHLSLVRLGQGVCGAMTVPIAIAYLGDLSPKGEEGRWMGYANAAFFSGFGFGPLIGGVVSEHIGMTTAFLILIGLNSFAFLVALFFLPEASTRNVGDDSSLLSFKEMRASHMIKGLFSFRLVQALGTAGIGAFLPIFASVIGLQQSLIGTLIAVNTLSVTLLTPLGGQLADKFNRRSLAILSSLLFSVLLVAIPFATSFTQMLAVLFIQGLVSAVAQPAAGALTVEEGRKYGMGSTMSIFFLAMSVGMAVGPIASGGISDALGVDAVFYFGAIMGLIGTALFAWFTRDYKAGE